MESITIESQEKLEEAIKHALDELGSALKTPAVLADISFHCHSIKTKFIEYCDNTRLLQNDKPKDNVTLDIQS